VLNLVSPKYTTLTAYFCSRPTQVYPPASFLLGISNSAIHWSRPRSHRTSGGDDSLELCDGNVTRRGSKGARTPAEDSDPKTTFPMLRHDLYPHVSVSLEPGDAAFFWQDLMHDGKTAKTYFSSACGQNAESSLKYIPSVRNWGASVLAGIARQSPHEQWTHIWKRR
jgi:hypothetical protein